MKSRNFVILAAVVIIVAAVAFAVSRRTAKPPATNSNQTTTNGSNSQSGSSNSTTAAATAVTIQGFAFSPASITVKKGSTVTWTNKDNVEHDVVSDTGSPAGGPNGPLLPQNNTYSFTFNTVGTFKYHCSPHPYMQGTVTVTE